MVDIRPDPAWYHMSSLTGKGYHGDRHPPIYSGVSDKGYEEKERVCTNCGKMARCLKPEYL